MEDGGDPSPEEDHALREELVRLGAKVERHPALVEIQKMEELDRAMTWYATNGAECLRVMEALNHDGLGFRLLAEDEVPFGDEHRDFITELGRTWHNYVAAAQSFSEHMQRQFRLDQPDDLEEEYKQKKRELLDSRDVVAFIERSRNILVHRGVFNTGFTFRFTQTKKHFEANCRTDILLSRYKTWWKDEAAIRYIETKAPRLNLRTVIEEHAAALDPLYSWYQERVYDYHYATLVEFEESARRHREISERLNPGAMSDLDESTLFESPEERKARRQAPPRPPKKRAKTKPKKRKRR